MPRKLRVEFPGAVYHVMSRGERREAIFLDDVDRHDFLKTLAEACQKTGWQVHAYCLMNSAEGRQEFERRIEARRLAETDEETLAVFRRGWCCGGPEFKQRMLELMDGKLGESHAGELRRETAGARAERIIAVELARLGWSEADLAERRKGDPDKMALATRLRKETTLTIKAISARLHLGTSKSANTRLHSWMRREPPSNGAEEAA